MKNAPKAVIAMLLTFCAVATSCSLDERKIEQNSIVEINGRDYPASSFEQGRVRLLLSEDLVSKLELSTDNEGVLQSSGVKSVDDVMASIGITRMERTFPYAGKFEPRTRKEGLHLWYDVYFDEDVVLTRAGEELSGIQGVRSVEYRPKVVRITGQLVPGSVTDSPVRSSGQAATDLFDDPWLDRQWHYYNDGSIAGTIAGSDINVLPAWERGIVGKSDVIVSVVDGGIDYDHEDLADNMWVNDDPDLTDGERHGFNFIRNNYKITDDEHGTHVAGTVAAVNNNGIGVCGVAGGDKAHGIPGVKLMSCQIFEGMSSGDGVRAIKWGADHGAVISQNSWGYNLMWSGMDDTPESDKAAIDYFIKYAGFDENGVQTGPMAGGVVIFAAGNDEMDIGFPAEYEACIAVAAIAGDYEAAYYTNYGDWVDIAAPGGDEYKDHLVYSTLPNNTYGGFQGTSMACPHVSGIAALMVSQFGGPGFTNTQLREMLELAVRDISAYNDPDKYIGKGLVDVEMAMAMDSDIAPDAVTEFSAEARSNFIDFSLTVPADADGEGGIPAIATLHYSKSDFDPEDSLAVNELPFYEIPLKGLKVGDVATGSAGGLEFNTEYYVSASVRDYARNRSKLYPKTIKVRTGGNTAPELVPGDDVDIVVPYTDKVDLDFEVVDPDGHTITAQINRYEGVSASMLGNNVVRVTFDGPSMKDEAGTVNLKVSDGFGGEDAVKIDFTLMTNFPPEAVAPSVDLILEYPKDKTKLVDLNTSFMDKDGDKLVYTLVNPESDVLTASIQHNTMVIDCNRPGATSIKVIAYDAELDSASVVYNVVVRDGGKLADFYPNPMSDVLNIRTGEEVSGAVLTIRDAYGNTKVSIDGLSSSPDAPAAVDVSFLPAGIYQARMTWTSGNGTPRTMDVTLSKI